LSGDTAIPEVSDDLKNIREFWSPYSLQFLEDLSWNLNRYKTLPLGISINSMQNQWTLGNPQGLGLDSGNWSGRTGVGHSLMLGTETLDFDTDPATSTAVVDKYLSDRLVSMPLVSDVAHDNADFQSQMRKLLTHFNDQSSIHENVVNGVGKYHAQLSSGVCYYTFNNTGDSKMCVDIVVHKMKDGTSLGEHIVPAVDGKWAQHVNRITDTIVKNYSAGWMERRTRNIDDLYLKPVNEKPKPLDIIFNPKVKFLPSSCRTLKYTADDVNRTDNIGDIANVHPDIQNTNRTEYEQQTRQFNQSVHTPPFVEVKREQIFVLPGKRKTFALRLPTKSYDPTKANYKPGDVLNEHGYHVLFGVTGERTRTVVPGREGTAYVEEGPTVIGVDHAPTSFKVIGRYYESVLPAVCIDPDNYTEQGLDLDIDAPTEGVDLDNAFSANFNDISARDVDGRYVKVGVDGKVTQARKMQKIDSANQRKNDIIAEFDLAGSPTKTLDLDAMTQAAVVTPNIAQAFANATVAVKDGIDGILTEYGGTLDPTGTDAEKLAKGRNEAAEALVYMAKITGTTSSMGDLQFGASLAEKCKWLTKWGGLSEADQNFYCGSAGVTAAIGKFTLNNMKEFFVDKDTNGKTPFQLHLEGIGMSVNDAEDMFGMSLVMKSDDDDDMTERRLAADGTQIVYIDEDQTTPGIQDIDDNVNVTNNLSVDLPAGQIAFTSVGLNKLAALKNSPLTQLEIGNIQYWSQQLYHEYETVANLTATNADPDTGHLRLLQLTYKVQTSVTLGSGVIFPNTGSSAITWLPGSGNTYNWFDLVRGVDWIVS
jgi:hypothetical protein